MLWLKIHYCDVEGVIGVKPSCLQKKPQTAQLGSSRGSCVGRGFTVVGPKATHLPHEHPKKRNRLFQRVLPEPLTPWFSPLVWAMWLPGFKLEETLGLL